MITKIINHIKDFSIEEIAILALLFFVAFLNFSVIYFVEIRKKQFKLDRKSNKMV